MTLVVLARRHTADQCGETEVSHTFAATSWSKFLQGIVSFFVVLRFFERGICLCFANMDSANFCTDNMHRLILAVE